MLEGPTYPGKRDLVYRNRCQIVAIEHDVAGIWPVNAVDAVQERSFAGTVRADYRNELAIARAESNAIQSRQTAEPQYEFLDFERHQPHHRRLRRYCLMSR